MNAIRYYLTCPVFYANATPHLGHTYTLCLADAWARYARIRCHPSLLPFNHKQTIDIVKRQTESIEPTCFLTSGVDEHGIKVKRAAHTFNKSPKDFCDELSPLFKSLCQSNSVELRDFVRTTEDRHQAAVHEVWRRLESGGHLYADKYSGWYSVLDETFYPEREVVALSAGETKSQTSMLQSTRTPTSVTHVTKDTGNPVEWIEESNYRFRLSAFRSRLHKWLDSGVLMPSSQSQSVWCDTIRTMIDSAEDMSVSRPSNRLDWGIAVPNDSDQVIYVWLDALVSYLTAVGFPWSDTENQTAKDFWPPHFQFIGKDILRFHAVLWPALLMAIDLPLPKHFICHHHLLVDGKKMSKSLGNVADPFEEQEMLSPHPNEPGKPLAQADMEGLRYVLLRSALLTADCSYSRSMATHLINTELVNQIGNLLSRVSSKRLNPSQSVVRITRAEAGAIFDGSEQDAALLEKLDSLAERFDEAWWSQVQPNLAIEHVISLVRSANAFLDRHKPWDSEPTVEREHVIAVAAECLRLTGLLLEPVIPNLADRLLCRLGVRAHFAPDSSRPVHNKYFWTLGSQHKTTLLRRLPEKEE